MVGEVGCFQVAGLLVGVGREGEVARHRAVAVKEAVVHHRAVVGKVVVAAIREMGVGVK